MPKRDRRQKISVEIFEALPVGSTVTGWCNVNRHKITARKVYDEDHPMAGNVGEWENKWANDGWWSARSNYSMAEWFTYNRKERKEIAAQLLAHSFNAEVFAFLRGEVKR